MIKSVTRNGRSIVLTAVLALILVYLFSIVGYIFFKDDFILEVDRLPNATLSEWTSHEPRGRLDGLPSPLACSGCFWRRSVLLSRHFKRVEGCHQSMKAFANHHHCHLLLSPPVLSCFSWCACLLLLLLVLLLVLSPGSPAPPVSCSSCLLLLLSPGSPPVSCSSCLLFPASCSPPGSPGAEGSPSLANELLSEGVCRTGKEENCSMEAVQRGTIAPQRVSLGCMTSISFTGSSKAKPRLCAL